MIFFGLHSHFFVSSSSTRRPCTPFGGRKMGQSLITWSVVCSSAPHSQVGEVTTPYLCAVEQNNPTPVRKRFRRTQDRLGRVIPIVWGANVGDESAEFCWIGLPFRTPFIVCPTCRGDVVFVGFIEKPSGGWYKWVSPSQRNSAGRMTARVVRLSVGVGRRHPVTVRNAPLMAVSSCDSEHCDTRQVRSTQQ